MRLILWLCYDLKHVFYSRMALWLIWMLIILMSRPPARFYIYFHRKMDGDKDGKISIQDFTDSVAEQPLLMEAFGECLPYNKGNILKLRNIT